MSADSSTERALGDFPFSTEWISNCCGAYCLGHLEEFPNGRAGGICNDCHEHAEFVLEGEEES